MGVGFLSQRLTADLHYISTEIAPSRLIVLDVTAKAEAQFREVIIPLYW